jgi:hypothetical protein
VISRTDTTRLDVSVDLVVVVVVNLDVATRALTLILGPIATTPSSICRASGPVHRGMPSKPVDHVAVAVKVHVHVHDLVNDDVVTNDLCLSDACGRVRPARGGDRRARDPRDARGGDGRGARARVVAVASLAPRHGRAEAVA